MFGILHHRSGKKSQTTSFTNDIDGSVLASQLASLCSTAPLVILVMTTVDLENSRNYVDELCNYVELSILQSRPSHVIPFQSILSSSPRLMSTNCLCERGRCTPGKAPGRFTKIDALAGRRAMLPSHRLGARD